MLTADLVHTRRRGEDLFVVPLEDARRELAREMAEVYRQLALAHVGRDRQTLLEAYKGVTASWPQAHRRLADGLQKLTLDRCVFEEETPLAASEVRALVFGRAADVRRGALAGGFDRQAVLNACAAELGHPPETLEAALYGDLPGAHVLRDTCVPPADTLLALYDLAQVQAVLLRATGLTVTVAADDPRQFRHLFRTLKFHQLLFTIEPSAKGGYQLRIDGPYSLFDAVTRYGLKLALALPAILACARWSLTAEVLWGRERQRLRFRCKGEGKTWEENAPPPPEPVAQILERWPGLESGFVARPSVQLLDLPGVGVCVPDLEFWHEATGTTVYYEQLGFWSRDAVWKRVELAEAGLPFPIVFGVSKSLRVSEAALSDALPAALYVFGKVPSARALLERVQQVAARVPPHVEP